MTTFKTRDPILFDSAAGERWVAAVRLLTVAVDAAAATWMDDDAAGLGSEAAATVAEAFAIDARSV